MKVTIEISKEERDRILKFWKEVEEEENPSSYHVRLYIQNLVNHHMATNFADQESIFNTEREAQP